MTRPEKPSEHGVALNDSEIEGKGTTKRGQKGEECGKNWGEVMHEKETTDGNEGTIRGCKGGTSGNPKGGAEMDWRKSGKNRQSGKLDGLKKVGLTTKLKKTAPAT